MIYIKYVRQLLHFIYTEIHTIFVFSGVILDYSHFDISRECGCVLCIQHRTMHIDNNIIIIISLFKVITTYVDVNKGMKI